MKELDQPQADLDAAVDKYFKDNGWDGFTTGWLLVAHQYRVDDETEGMDNSRHPIVYMGGTMPDHIALGLTQVANDIIRHTGRWGRDDEEES